MNSNWVIKPIPPSEIVDQLIEKVWLPKPLAIILAQREVVDFVKAKAFFRPELDSLHDPFLLKDMDKAVSRIQEALKNQEKILIYGDYDVDGTTSVAMMFSFLKSIYEQVDYYIPDRSTEGYGVSIKGIDYAKENGFTLIISLDCGIKAIEKVEYANENQIDFIICDHHLAGETLPSAYAVLDPKRADCTYPFKELSGCGVGFKLIQALVQILELDPKLPQEFLDFLVVSIAADIVPITGENRIFAHYGLEKLMKHPRMGLAGLMGELPRESLNISNIVFSIAPKINATGRLEHASQSVELLISDDEDQVKTFASQITEINDQRKETDGTVTEEAIELIKKNHEENHYSTVVYDPDWHKGVLGIVASRLTDTYYRPTLVLTNGNPGEITGSARSVKDFDIYEIIDACSDLLIRYGGHRFAAGLTMPVENFDAFKTKFEALVKEKIKPSQRIPTVEIDVEIDFEEIDDKFLRILKQMEPFGPENMTPVFLTTNLIGGDLKLMGKNNEHLRLTLQDENSLLFNAVGFGMGKHAQDFERFHFDLVYTIEENFWKNKSYLQFNIRDVRFHY